MIAGQRIDVIFHGCRASGRLRGGNAGTAAAVASRVVLWGENLRYGGGHSVHEESKENLGVQPCEYRVTSVVGKLVEVTERLPPLELQFDLPAQLIGMKTTFRGEAVAC